MPSPFNTLYPDGRRSVMRDGENDGRDEAEKLYPQVLHTPSEVKEAAYKRIEAKFQRVPMYMSPNYTDDREEYKRLYVQGFVTAYLTKVAYLDARESKFTGSVSIRKVEHKDGINTYRIALSEYPHLKKTYEFEVVISPDENINLQER